MRQVRATRHCFYPAWLARCAKACLPRNDDAREEPRARIRDGRPCTTLANPSQTLANPREPLRTCPLNRCKLLRTRRELSRTLANSSANPSRTLANSCEPVANLCELRELVRTLTNFANSRELSRTCENFCELARNHRELMETHPRTCENPSRTCANSWKPIRELAKTCRELVANLREPAAYPRTGLFTSVVMWL